MGRTVEIKHKFPEYAIYTDASASKRITAALVCNNEKPPEYPIIDELMEAASSPMGDTFEGATYIYGRDMLAIVGILLPLGGELRNKTVVFYLDNFNCRDALVRWYTATKLVDSLVRIFRHMYKDYAFTRCSDLYHQIPTHLEHRRDSQASHSPLGIGLTSAY